MTSASIESPTLRAVAEGMLTVAELWQRIERDGAPMIEHLAGDPAHRLVTFVLRGSSTTRNAVVVGGPAGFDTRENSMQRLAECDVWYRSYRVPREARCFYQLSENDSLIPPWEMTDPETVASEWRSDALNPRTYEVIEVEGSPYTRSLLELPDAPALVDSVCRAGVPRGAVARHRVESRILGDARNVDVYLPSATYGAPRALVIVFDGVAFTRTVATPTILDNLHAGRRIPPTAALFVDSKGALRNRELPCHAPFARFIASELHPWAERLCGPFDAARTVLAGASYGGVASAYVARAHPELFGNVLSLSGAYWVRGDDSDGDGEFAWLPRRYAEEPKRPLRFYQNIGLFEAGSRICAQAPDQLAVNRRMRDALQARGYDVTYREYPGGHDWICWEQHLPEALEVLLGALR